ncbi:MAG TPA: immunoglobulin domain-containing protein, partial [Phycisphaerae bacterium]|nr:immunoglobulin domain-containing protein [Phycisphaerae bacterium]
TAVPFIPGGDGDNHGEVLALNGDGTLAGGYSRYAGSPQGPKEAFLWDAANGTRRLQDVLTTQYGLTLNDWVLEEVCAISADGKVIAGNGLHNGVAEGWVVAFVPYTPPPPPVILEQPQSQQACVGSTVVFAVSASGEGALTYRWQKDGSDVADGGQYAGAATPVLTVSGVSAEVVGQYQCVICNAGGCASSDPTLLNIGTPFVGDLDMDCDVDLADFGEFQNCFNGPNRPLPARCTVNADFDGDGDVDIADFSVFQRCFNGPNRLPAC